MADLVTSTGVKLTETPMTHMMDAQAKRRAVDVKAYVATFPTGEQQYVLVENGAVVYENTSAEAVAYRIDLLCAVRARSDGDG